MEMNTRRVQMEQFVSNTRLDASVCSEVLVDRLNEKRKVSQFNSFPRRRGFRGISDGQRQGVCVGFREACFMVRERYAPTSAYAICKMGGAAERPSPQNATLIHIHANCCSAHKRNRPHPHLPLNPRGRSRLVKIFAVLRMADDIKTSTRAAFRAKSAQTASWTSTLHQ